MTARYPWWVAVQVLGMLVGTGYVLAGAAAADVHPVARLVIAALAAGIWAMNLRTAVVAAEVTPDRVLALRCLLGSKRIAAGDLETRRLPLRLGVNVRARGGAFLWWHLPDTKATRALLASL